MEYKIFGEIGFENCKIFCVMGCLPEERKNEQPIFVDLKVQVEMAPCMQTDQLQDTVDIMQLVRVCTELAKKHRYHLIEAYAGAVLQTLLNQFPIRAGWIRVKKPNGIPAADFSFVELSQKRT